MRRTLLVLVALCSVAVPALGDTITWPTANPRGVVYDTAAHARTLRDMIGEDGWVQQQPVTSVFAASRQAWKVTTRTASGRTPSLLGLTGPQIAALLTDRINRSGARLVFVDELDDPAVTAVGAPLAEALALLSNTTTPAGDTYASRVHIYLGPPRRLLADPAHPAWDALARAGGVWLEAYTSTREWDEPEWAVWPDRTAQVLASRGVPAERLRLLMTGTGNWMMSARVCAWRTGGVGVYRADEDMAAWVTGWLQTFRDNLFPCVSPPAPSAAQLADLAQLQTLAAPRAITPANIIAEPLWANRRTRICLRGLALVYGPGTRFQARGAGASNEAVISGSGDTCLVLRPARPGNITLRLRAPDGRMWQQGVMWGVDYGVLTAAVIANPADPVLVTPLVGNALVAGMLTVRPVPTPARLRLAARQQLDSGTRPRSPPLGGCRRARARACRRTGSGRARVAHRTTSLARAGEHRRAGRGHRVDCPQSHRARTGRGCRSPGAQGPPDVAVTQIRAVKKSSAL